MKAIHTRRFAHRVFTLLSMVTLVQAASPAAAQVVQIHTANGTDTSYFGNPLKLRIHLDARQFKWLEAVYMPMELHFDNGNMVGPIGYPQVEFLPASEVFTNRAVGYSDPTDPDTVLISCLSFSSVYWQGAADLATITVAPLDVGRIVFTEIPLGSYDGFGAWVQDEFGQGDWVNIDWNSPTIVVEPCPSDRMGDVNQDTVITTADIIHLVNYIFKSGPAPLPVPLAGDADCSRRITSGDIVYLAAYIFRGGPIPCPCSTPG